MHNSDAMRPSRTHSNQSHSNCFS